MLTDMEGSLTRLRQLQNELSPSETKVAETILSDPEQVINLTITELAAASGSSTAAITRLCKRIGLSGYSDLRMDIAKVVFSSQKQQEGPLLLDPTQMKDSKVIISSVILAVCRNIKLLEDVLDAKSVEKAADVLDDAHHILLAGIGASGLVAADFQQKLIRLGIHSLYQSDPDVQQVCASTLEKDDVCVVFSYSGNTVSMKRVASLAKKRKATVIAVTRVGTNGVSSLSDIKLQVPDSETLYRQGATLSRLNQLVVVDILYASLIAKKKNSLEYITTTWLSLGRDAKGGTA
ncbi:MAG: MurR/RpiR family transcriptional regulator [Sphaerochaetaceae bacterium]|jgi:DNA-binding MurR/RpiR family transcriptional regulator